MGAPPARCLLVGDSAVDVRTALAAGMVPVGVTWGLRPREELQAAGAAALIDAPGELLALL
jgi:phosphoglycolate phosphatase